jgi:hypothetical protein
MENSVMMVIQFLEMHVIDSAVLMEHHVEMGISIVENNAMMEIITMGITVQIFVSEILLMLALSV